MWLYLCLDTDILLNTCNNNPIVYKWLKLALITLNIRVPYLISTTHGEEMKPILTNPSLVSGMFHPLLNKLSKGKRTVDPTCLFCSFQSIVPFKVLCFRQTAGRFQKSPHHWVCSAEDNKWPTTVSGAEWMPLWGAGVHPTHTHTFGKFRVTNWPYVVSLGCWKKPKYLEQTHTDTGRTWKTKRLCWL